MNNYIIVGINGRPSIFEMMETFNFKNKVSVIAAYNKKNGNHVFKLVNIEKDGFLSLLPITKINFSPTDKIIYWGTRVDFNVDKGIIYNAPKNINSASNKALCRKIFQKKGIPTPLTKFTAEEAKRDLSFPIIIRPDRHRAGKDFFVAKNKEEVDLFSKKVSNPYFSEFYPKKAEFRVHVALGKVLIIKRKPDPENKDQIAWNFAQTKNPWTTIPWGDYNYDMVKIAINAIKAVNLDFGAVDIMSFAGNNFQKHVVAEINTAPSFTPYLISRYGAIFEKIFSSKERVSVFDTSNFKKAKSFAWKNFQLK